MRLFCFALTVVYRLDTSEKKPMTLRIQETMQCSNNNHEADLQ